MPMRSRALPSDADAVDDARAFVEFSDHEARCRRPYLIVDRGDGRLLGGSGLAFEADDRASTGYVLAKDAWVAAM
jgi:hypothetical protein